jgi:hypothetical protein
MQETNRYLLGYGVSIVVENPQNAGEFSSFLFHNIKIIFPHIRADGIIGYTAVGCMRELLPKDLTQSKFV